MKTYPASNAPWRQAFVRERNAPEAANPHSAKTPNKEVSV